MPCAWEHYKKVDEETDIGVVLLEWRIMFLEREMKLHLVHKFQNIQKSIFEDTLGHEKKITTMWRNIWMKKKVLVSILSKQEREWKVLC